MQGVVSLLLVSVSLAFSLQGSPEVLDTGNAIDDLMIECLEYGRWLLRRHEPLSFPPLPNQKIVTKNVQLEFSTHGVELSKASDFTVDKISNDLEKMESSFRVTVPTARLAGRYAVSGRAIGKDVQGSGSFEVDIEKFVQIGDFQYVVVDGFLMIKELNLDYELAGVKFDVDGLSIDGLTESEVESFLNERLLGFLQQNKNQVCKEVSGRILQVLSQVLYGLTLQDVIEWLESIVASTPDPPPFPGN